MRRLTTTGGQVGIEVVQALDVWPARRQEFGRAMTHGRGAGGDWRTTTPTGGPRLSVTAAQ
jgi:hypothetical protein